MVNKKKHLRKKERIKIETLLEEEKSYRYIAKRLERGKTTIQEEVERNGGKEKYDAEKAHHRAYLRQYRKKKGCNKVAMNRDTQMFVEKRLEAGWSPETIAIRLHTQSGVTYASGKSIRKYVAKRSGLERHLFWNRHHKKGGPKKKKRSERLTCRVFIDKRPPTEGVYGHWEGDFIVSKHNTWVFLVLVEKFTKKVLIRRLPKRNNDVVNDAIVSLFKGYTVTSLTLDNDIAFQKHTKLAERLECSIYFTHPYHSWEKGLVENMNRWIRQFVPKKTNFAQVTDVQVQSIQDWLNHTPRQCLNGSSPYEMMMKIQKKTTVSSLVVNLPVVRIWG